MVLKRDYVRQACKFITNHVCEQILRIDSLFIYTKLRNFTVSKRGLFDGEICSSEGNMHKSIR